MKTLSLLLALGLPVLAARADTFRVYVVATKSTAAPQDRSQDLRPLELLQTVVGEEAVLQAYAEVVATPEKPGRHEALVEIPYVETWDPVSKRATKRATRTAGTIVGITFIKGDEVRLDFKDTRLDRWIVHDLEAGALQPAFITREASIKAVAPAGTVTLVGAVQNDENRIHYLVHRLPAATP